MSERDLAAWEAPRLFAERAAAAQHGFAISDSNAWLQGGGQVVTVVVRNQDSEPMRDSTAYGLHESN